MRLVLSTFHSRSALAMASRRAFGYGFKSVFGAVRALMVDGNDDDDEVEEEALPYVALRIFMAIGIDDAT